MKIVVRSRTKDYYATVDGKPEIVGIGDTPLEAIGKLIQLNKDKFGITEITNVNF